MKNATVSGIHFTFAAENIRDNNLKTWWSPTTNDVYTSWIKIVFAGEEVISRMDIHGGSHYPDFPENDLYEHNYRLRTGTITFSDNTEIGFELRDIDRIQTIEFPEKETKYIIIKPKTFYETKKYKDFCVSEIKVY